MIKQFRSLHPFNIILLVLIALLLRLPFWNQLIQQSPPNFQHLFNHLLIPLPAQPKLSITTQMVLGLISLLIQALLLNKVVNTHNLIGKSSFMPALLFVVCASFFKVFVFFSPVMLCNFLIIWMIDRFLNIYRKKEIRPLIFDIGLAVALGTLIYAPFVMMLPLVWMSLMIFRPFNWREWVIGFLGFATVFFFLGFYYFWNNALSEINQAWLPMANTIQKVNYWMFLPLLIIIVLGLFRLRSNFFRSVVHIRKSYQLLLMFFLLALCGSTLNIGTDPDHFLLAAVPVAIILAYYFIYARMRWFYESLFLYLIASMLYFNFFHPFNFF